MDAEMSSFRQVHPLRQGPPQGARPSRPADHVEPGRGDSSDHRMSMERARRIAARYRSLKVDDPANQRASAPDLPRAQQAPRKGSHPSAEKPRLRLTEPLSDSKVRREARGVPTMGASIEGATDPRWVLAVRTADVLEGQVLRPERRERLMKLGKMLGLSPFDCNLIMAIVQDQARRGYAPNHCPTAGAAQLTMVPLPKPRRQTPLRRWLNIATAITGIVLLEIIMLYAIFG